MNKYLSNYKSPNKDKYIKISSRKFVCLRWMRIYPIFFCLLSLSSCCIKYTFNGASLPKSVQTFFVAYIENKANLVAPNLSTVFTEKLKLKLTNETSLKMSNNNADLVFEGQIRNYTVSNIAQQSGNQVASNRLTITVYIKSSNRKDSTLSFEQEFSAFADFSGTSALSAVEEQLINEISDQLVQQIFNRAVINW